MRYLFLILIGVAVSACASVHSMPQTANDVDFSPALEGRTGFSQYEEVFFLRGVDRRTAYLAAKEGLSESGFTIKKASYDDGMAIGEHGITAYDWNVVAGVYIQDEPTGTGVKVLVEGSKDIGFWGDMTAESWPQKIFKNMKDYILTESLIDNPNKKHFQ